MQVSLSERLVEWLLEHGGLWGVMTLLLLLAVIYQEKERKRLTERLEQEHRARLEDAKSNTSALLTVAEKTHEALETVGRLAKR